MPNVAAAQGHAVAPSFLDNVANVSRNVPIDMAIGLTAGFLAQRLGVDISLVSSTFMAAQVGTAIRGHQEMVRNPQNAYSFVAASAAVNAGLLLGANSAAAVVQAIKG